MIEYVNIMTYFKHFGSFIFSCLELAQLIYEANHNSFNFHCDNISLCRLEEDLYDLI